MVDSSTTSWPGCSTPASVVGGGRRGRLRSGSRELVSGVGTQITIASQAERSAWRGRRAQALGERRQGRVGHVLDVAAAGVQRLDLGRVDVEADHLVPRLGEGDGEGQADVAEADDPDLHRRAV